MTAHPVAPTHAELPPLAPDGAERRSLRLRRDVISYLDWQAGGDDPAAVHDPADGDDPAGGRDPAGTAILLHGLQSTALTMGRVAEGLSARGWRVIAPD